MKSAKLCAEMWANRLRAGNLGHAGDASPASVFGTVLAQRARDQLDITEEQIIKFQTALERMITEVFNGATIDGFRISGLGAMCLGTDYGPDLGLETALIEAGIATYVYVLPSKSMTWVYRDKVEAKFGYGAPITKFDCKE